MFELLNIGLDEENLKYMLESNPNISEISDEEIKEKIDLLNYLECSTSKIKNIITSNPWYLDRCTTDVIGTINKLIQLGLTRLDLLIDSNPFLLNIDVFEIEDFINRKLEENYTLDEITDMIEENSNIINE